MSVDSLVAEEKFLEAETLLLSLPDTLKPDEYYAKLAYVCQQQAKTKDYLKYAKAGAKAGSGECHCSLALYYEKLWVNLGSAKESKEKQKFIGHYEAAIKHENTQAMNDYGAYLAESGDLETAKRLWLRGAKMEDKDCIRNINLLLRQKWDSKFAQECCNFLNLENKLRFGRETCTLTTIAQS